MNGTVRNPAGPHKAKPSRPAVASGLAVWRALAASKFNREAEEVVRVGKELLRLVEAFVETHDFDGLADGLRAAGLGDAVNEYHEVTADRVLADMAGLAFVLELTVGIINSEIFPVADLPEEAAGPRRSR